MLKRFCDCCGKELRDVWYEMHPIARDNCSSRCLTETAVNSLANAFSTNSEYCKECVSAAMDVLKKKY